MILEVCWDGLRTLSFGLSQFCGHGSWLVCEVAPKYFEVSVVHILYITLTQRTELGTISVWHAHVKRRLLTMTHDIGYQRFITQL